MVRPLKLIQLWTREIEAFLLDVTMGKRHGPLASVTRVDCGDVRRFSRLRSESVGLYTVMETNESLGGRNAVDSAMNPPSNTK